MDILGLIALARSKGGGGGSGSGTFVPSFGTLATIQTGVSWFGDDPYTLTVLVSGYTVTSNTMISVLPSIDVVEQMMADEVTNIFITNNNGVLTATAVGGAPSAAMTLQVLCSESDQVESISALPGIVGDGVLETLQATDLTDAINQLSSDLDDAKNAIGQKQDAPSTAGTAGQVLGLDSNLAPVWVNQSGGGGGVSDYTQLTNKPQINGHTLDGNKSASDLGLGTYSKPASGISKTDLASDVQASLGKADTALQTAPVQSVAGKTGAVNLGAGDVGFNSSEEYNEGTVGEKLSTLNRQLSDLEDTVSTTQIINTASGAIASFSDGADNRQIKKIVGTIVPVQSGSGDPSPDNVRPISGWTVAEIYHSSGQRVQLQNPSDGTYNGVVVKSNPDGSVSYNGNCTANESCDYYRGTISQIGMAVNKTYTAYLDAEIQKLEIIAVVGGSTQTLVDITSGKSTFTIPTGTTGVIIRVLLTAGVAYDTTVRLVIAGEELNQISVNWEDDAGTIYGGTLTINPDRTGTLTVTHKSVTLTGAEAFTWTKYGDQTLYTSNTVLPGAPNTQAIKGWCSAVATLQNGNIDATFLDKTSVTSPGIEFKKCIDYWGLSEVTAAALTAKLAEMNSSGKPFQIVYKLNNPVTIHLTAEQISGILETLYGTNNIWSSTGDTEVTYPADTKLYLSDKQDAPATAGTAGQVLALDDNLNPVWANQSGGGGGTTDYAQLSNKPTINNVELSGNKTLAELGINAGSVGFDETETYAAGSIGAEVSAQKNAISQKEDALSIVQKTSSDVTITLEEDKFYIFPTMTELTVTCPLTGLYGFRFTSGTTPTVFLMSGITMPDNWNGTEASKTYDMTILNGLALVTSWSV